MSKEQCLVCGRRRRHGVSLFKWPDSHFDDWPKKLLLDAEDVRGRAHPKICSMHFLPGGMVMGSGQAKLTMYADPFTNEEAGCVDGKNPLHLS